MLEIYLSIQERKEGVVVDITRKALNSVDNYFNTLAQFGYKKQLDVDKLLILLFIEELLTEEMRFFVTEEDYRSIDNALNCLYGSSCLIPYPQYINDDSLFGTMGKGLYVTGITEYYNSTISPYCGCPNYNH